MKTAAIASFCVSALFILMPGANAQQASTRVSYTPQPFPGVPSYPGVSADILGIRIGMTVSQAEAIAEKSYPIKSQEASRNQDTFAYKGLTVQSHPYAQYVTYHKQKAQGGEDRLSLYFSGPATSNRLYAMTREIAFNNNVFRSKNALIDPSISALEASLIKKYGSPTFVYLPYIWAFTQKSRIDIKNDEFNSYANVPIQFYTNAPIQRGTALSGQIFDNGDCGTVRDRPINLLINAMIRANGIDKTKVDSLKISIWDPPACLNDIRESIRQLKANAIKIYKTVKAPAATTL